MVALEQELLAARREIDALKGSAQSRCSSGTGSERGVARPGKRRKSWLISRVSWPRANSAKGVALEQELLAARREIDALKGSAQTTAAEREEARRALAAVQRELDAMRRVARNGSASWS